MIILYIEMGIVFKVLLCHSITVKNGARNIYDEK